MEAAAADGKGGALGGAGRDIVENLLQVRLGDQRAHLDIVRHRVADCHGAGAFDERGFELGGDRRLDENAGGVRADLAGGVEIGVQRGLDREVEIGVCKHQQR